MSLQTIYIWYIYMYNKIWHTINHNGCYAIKSNQTKSYIYFIYIHKEDLSLNKSTRVDMPEKLTQHNQILYIMYICIKRICH